MRQLFLSVVIAVAASVTVWTQATAPFDGNKWRTLSSVGKNAFAAGVVLGVAETAPFLYQVDPDIPATDRTSVGAVLAKQIGHITAGQLASGLDAFYDDFKNRLIPVPVAAYVVIRQIHGMPDSEVMALVQSLRSAADAP